jgi:hypothetical protein
MGSLLVNSDPVKICLMRRIKNTLDAATLLNPGKVVRAGAGFAGCSEVGAADPI